MSYAQMKRDCEQTIRRVAGSRAGTIGPSYSNVGRGKRTVSIKVIVSAHPTDQQLAQIKSELEQIYGGKVLRVAKGYAHPSTWTYVGDQFKSIELGSEPKLMFRFAL